MIVCLLMVVLKDDFCLLMVMVRDDCVFGDGDGER
jgi:hypothetical protein